MPRSNITNQERRRRVWDKANGLCAHCGGDTSGRNRTIDHVIPKSMGGGLDYNNLMPLCKRCNQFRSNGSVDPEIFYPYANEKAIQQCLNYKKRWLLGRTGSDGTHWSQYGR